MKWETVNYENADNILQVFLYGFVYLNFLLSIIIEIHSHYTRFLVSLGLFSLENIGGWFLKRSLSMQNG